MSQHSFIREGLRTAHKNSKPTRMFCKRLIGLIVITSVIVNDVVAKRPFNKSIQLAIFPMAGHEKLYLNIELLNLARLPNFIIKNEKNEEKKCVCEIIFSNPVMIDLRLADTVNPMDKEIQDILQSKHSDIYDRYYKAPNPAVLNQVDAQFMNSYRKYDFIISGTAITEYAYPCLTRSRVSNIIEEYFVSRIYSLPRQDDEVLGHKQKVASRFVFQHDREKNATTLIAMTDLAVEDVLPPHPRYCERTELTEPGRSKDLCEFPELQRTRLCATLFSSKNYTGQVQYVASTTGPECRESKLVIRCEKNRLEFTDLVVECEVKKFETDSNHSATYYISRGLRPYQFFVAEPMEDSDMPVVTHHFYSYILELATPKS